MKNKSIGFYFAAVTCALAVVTLILLLVYLAVWAYLRNTYNAHEPQLCLAGLNIRCLFTPGHKEDCVCYYLTDEGVLFSGDTLFRQSVGRTDLPGGNYSVLIQSLHDLLQLPADTTVYPGHSEPTTIGYEQQYNPFVHRLR